MKSDFYHKKSIITTFQTNKDIRTLKIIIIIFVFYCIINKKLYVPLQRVANKPGRL